ncbi:MAG TPA: alpha/beta hydrolase [Baekduia sp.]|nr:alpha/beta hydrolase [Baekduia sp.]
MTSPYQLDPQVAEAFAALAPKFADMPAVARGDWQGLRRSTNDQYDIITAVRGPRPPEVRCEELTIAVGDGAQLDARWYTHGDGRPGSAVVYVHGGGMIAGTLDHYDDVVGHYVLQSGVPFLSLAYRLAPEAQGLRPAEDVLAALLWLGEHADRRGLDPERIAVMGDSAGGGIAASAAILARDRGIALAHQILIYPMLDDQVTSVSPAIEPFLTWTPDANATAWAARRGEDDVVEPAAVPARVGDLRAVAPAYIEVGDLDLFRNESLLYAQRLAAADVPLELHVHASAPHGYDLVTREAEVSRRALLDRTRVLRAL